MGPGDQAQVLWLGSDSPLPQGAAGQLLGCDNRRTYSEAREGRGPQQKQAWMGCGGPGQLADLDSGFLVRDENLLVA